MNSGVRSRGSPMLKLIASTPAGHSALKRLSSFTNG
jgi:hypothetical protein